MKGWVYVITNKAMPGLVKVGYSTKDPELRAEELNHTGSPHPYIVDYELLIEEPFQVEKKTHKLLSPKREGKEWFRCSTEEAIAAIKQATGDRVITETYKHAERAKAEALRQQQLQQEEEAKRKAEVQARLTSEEDAVRRKYEQQLASAFPPRPFWVYWLGGFFIAMFGVVIMFPKASDGGVFMLSLIFGALIAIPIQGYLEKERKQSVEYLAMEGQRDAEIAAVRSPIFECGKCGKRLRFDRAEFLLSDKRITWSCPACKAQFSPPNA